MGVAAGYPLGHGDVTGIGNQMIDDFGVGGGMKNRAVFDQLPTQGKAVGQVAVVGQSQAAEIEFSEQRLDVA